MLVGLAKVDHQILKTLSASKGWRRRWVLRQNRLEALTKRFNLAVHFRQQRVYVFLGRPSTPWIIHCELWLSWVMQWNSIKGDSQRNNHQIPGITAIFSLFALRGPARSARQTASS